MGEWEQSVVPREGDSHPTALPGSAGGSIPGENPGCLLQSAFREHEGEGPGQAVPASQTAAIPGRPPAQHGWGIGAGTGGTAPARKPVGFSLRGFGLLSGMFLNLHLREEVCQRKYVTDCK